MSLRGTVRVRTSYVLPLRRLYTPPSSSSHTTLYFGHSHRPRVGFPGTFVRMNYKTRNSRRPSVTSQKSTPDDSNLNEIFFRRARRDVSRLSSDRPTYVQFVNPPPTSAGNLVFSVPSLLLLLHLHPSYNFLNIRNHL